MRVVAIDMRGFGKSPEMEYPYSLDDYANEVKEILDFLGEPRVNVIAHSFGARVIIRLAKQDKRIDKIVFTGAAGLKPRRSLKYFLKKASFFILKRFVKREKLKFLYSEDYRNLSEVKKKSFQKIVSDYLEKDLTEIESDCLLVFGKRDKETPSYMARKMKRLLKRANLTFMDGCGHFCFVQKPEQFNGIAFKFLMGNG